RRHDCDRKRRHGASTFRTIPRFLFPKNRLRCTGGGVVTIADRRWLLSSLFPQIWDKMPKISLTSAVQLVRMITNNLEGRLRMATDTRLGKLLAQLEAAGKRVTPQRVAVCEALLAHGNHPTIADIWQTVREQHPNISHATVYNTFAMLEEERLIQK